MPEFDPKSLFNNRVYGTVIEPASDKGTEFVSIHNMAADHSEVVLFVGYPASGKSTLAKRLVEEESYVHICQDMLGSLDRCVKAVREALKNKRKVIVDNTNVGKEQRKRCLYIYIYIVFVLTGLIHIIHVITLLLFNKIIILYVSCRDLLLILVNKYIDTRG